MLERLRFAIDEEACASSSLACFSGSVAEADGTEVLRLRIGDEGVVAEGSLFGRCVIDGRDAVVGELVHVEAFKGALPLLIAFDERSTAGSLSVLRCTPTYSPAVDDLEEHRRARVTWRVERLKEMRDRKRAMAALLPGVGAEVQDLEAQLAAISSWLDATGRR